MIKLTYDNALSRARRLHLEGKIYGVPNGGLHVVSLVLASRPYLSAVETPEEAEYFVDDIIDSGRTRDYYVSTYGKPFAALVDKQGDDKNWAQGKWISFPWERMARQVGVEENIVRLLQFIGDDPSREGLKETPARVVKSYQEIFSGYKVDPEGIVKTFEDGKCDEMVVLKDIEFFSMCEHHLLPFSGVAHIGYLPQGRIIGVSKLSRLLEVFARRLQVQERLTCQVTEALDKYLQPLGSACVLEARHSCMSCRGVNKNPLLITSSLTGVFREKPEVRAEFLQLVRG